jgi:hypothetical protein
MSRETRGRSLGALLAEAVMVVFAVLVALAVDEWREHREIAAQVARAEAGVEAELRANQEELRLGSASVQAMYDSVSSVVTRLQAGEVIREAGLGGNLPDFSDAAWETARVTGAVAHMPYQRVLRRARVYETHALARQAQDRVLSSFGGIVARGLQVDLLQELQGELFIALQVYAALAQRYDEALGAGDGSP